MRPFKLGGSVSLVASTVERSFGDWDVSDEDPLRTAAVGRRTEGVCPSVHTSLTATSASGSGHGDRSFQEPRATASGRTDLSSSAAGRGSRVTLRGTEHRQASKLKAAGQPRLLVRQVFRVIEVVTSS